MFTGIVEEMGTVVGLARGGEATRLSVKATVSLEGSDVGASVAVNGACLTVVERRADDARSAPAERPRQPRAAAALRGRAGRPPCARARGRSRHRGGGNACRINHAGADRAA